MTGTARKVRVALAGGGTGGHLFPGLTVARELVECRPEIEPCFVGSGRPIEQEQIPRAGFSHQTVPAAHLPRNPLGWPRFLLTNYRAFRRARRLMRDQDIQLVVGLGGYGAAPMARAAGALGRPLVLLEQNSVPGRANRYLAKWAAVVCATYEHSRSFFPPGARVEMTGNPVRPEIAAGGAGRPDLGAWELDPARRTLLVWGGSQGAHNVNEALAALADRLADVGDAWQVLHQAGPDDAGTLRRRYAEAGVLAHVQPFFQDTPAVFAAADLAVARAGATSIAEFACMGLPAVFMPYPHAADDHQTRNAEELVEAGAAALVPDRSDPSVNAPALWSALAPLLDDTDRRAAMGAAMRRWARPDAARRVAQTILELLAPGV